MALPLLSIAGIAGKALAWVGAQGAAATAALAVHLAGESIKLFFRVAKMLMGCAIFGYICYWAFEQVITTSARFVIDLGWIPDGHYRFVSFLVWQSGVDVWISLYIATLPFSFLLNRLRITL